MCKLIVLRLKFAHETQPITFRASFCLIDSPAHRFLIGRDLLIPLKFEASAVGLRLTDPKSGQSTLFEYDSAPVSLCTSDPFLGHIVCDIVPTKGDTFGPLSATLSGTSVVVRDADVMIDTSADVTPTKGDIPTLTTADVYDSAVV